MYINFAFGAILEHRDSCVKPKEDKDVVSSSKLIYISLLIQQIIQYRWVSYDTQSVLFDCDLCPIYVVDLAVTEDHFFFF